MENISEKHGLREADEDRSVDETDNGYDRYAVPLFVAEIGQYLYYSQTKEQTTMFDAFRAYNSVIREV